MKTNFSTPLFTLASNEVFEKLDDNFKELKKVQVLKYNTDPRKWKNV